MKRGWSLDEVNRSTRISLKYLEAMETDVRQAFPAAFFYRSFVLQYARKLGLDEAKINTALDAALASEAPPALPGQNFHHPLLARDLARIHTPRRSRRFSGKLAVSLGSLAIALAASSALSSWWNRPHAKIQAAQQQPLSKQTVAARKPAKPAEVATAPVPAPAPAVSAEKAPVRLNLSATEPTWLSVSSDGKPAFRGMLQPQQTRELEAEQTAHLIVGNAGGLIVEWNGRTLGPIGRRGQVRVVSFTPEGYRFEDSATITVARDATE